MFFVPLYTLVSFSNSELHFLLLPEPTYSSQAHLHQQQILMKHPPKSPAISGLMMHILVIVTIIRTLFIFLSRLSAWLNDSKGSISYPLLNYHLNFFVNTWNGRQLMLFCTIVPLVLYPCCWFTVGDCKSLRRASFLCSRFVSDRWLD